ncbi:HNH endonuclease [Peribacillus asahii]|uniref:HNH endonuclease n=1 Tax=Peribacillus asahii TaxID=228899 RepID=UPI00380E8823
MSIPKNINREHVIESIQKVDREGVPERRESTRFSLLYEGKYYPPKYVVSIANIFANGEEYSPSLFSGGEETNRFLKGLGFSIVETESDKKFEKHKNTWIFQANPEIFDIDNYVKDHKYIWWALRQGRFCDIIELDDEVFMWRSNGDKRGTGGILAKTRVVGLPQERPNDESAKDYWHNEDWKKPYLGVKLEVLEVKILEGFIRRSSLLDHHVLNELLILSQWRQTNYLLSPEHSIELQKLWNISGSNTKSEIDTIGLEILIDSEITETEKEQIIKSRIGQSSFKRDLLAIETKCRLCGLSDERFLVASHIKPWSQSSNQERLDVNNGLLLCPNHDALFDKGYISFDDDGTILISDSLDEATRVFLNINETMNIKMNEGQQEYMKWHRGDIFNYYE